MVKYDNQQRINEKKEKKINFSESNISNGNIVFKIKINKDVNI